MKKFPKIKYPNDPETDGVLADEVVVLEKLDGANFRFQVEDGNIRMGTRNTEFDIDSEDVPKAFYHARDWLRDLTDIQMSVLDGVGTLYGEAMHLHSLEYQDVEYEVPESGSAYFADRPSVYLFDWHNGDDWVHWDTFIDMTAEAGLPTTRVLARGDPTELETSPSDMPGLEIPEESMFGGPPEGIVVRRVDGTVRAKKVSEDFKETNATSFNDPSKAQSDAAEFVAMFVTDQRVEKMAHKLVDQGEYDALQMQMMEQLPLAVLRDVMEEEGGNLLLDEYGFECEFDSDFKGEVRSKASKKCARVLKTLCQEF